MCGIIISNDNKYIRTKLAQQTDRGLDSLGLINIKNERYNIKRFVGSLQGYIKGIKKNKADRGLTFVHHRKATIGAINLDNSHPFIGDNFMLFQNGTARNFNNKYSFFLGGEVDTQNLLKYIEYKTDELLDIPKILEDLSEETKDTFGIVVVSDGDRYLIYLDGARESYINIKDDKLISFSNYREGQNEGYKNKGYLLIDINGKIIENTITEVNTVDFKVKYTYVKPEDNYYNKGWKALCNPDYVNINNVKVDNDSIIDNNEGTDYDAVYYAFKEYLDSFYSNDLPKLNTSLISSFLDLYYSVTTYKGYLTMYGVEFPSDALNAAYEDYYYFDNDNYLYGKKIA